jgi:hypothetical protein
MALLSLTDSLELRIILCVLYTMTEILRTTEDQELRETFIQDLSK